MNKLNVWEMSISEKIGAMIWGLTRLISFLNNYGEVLGEYTFFSMYLVRNDKDEFKNAARILARGGKVTKEYVGDTFRIVRKFGPLVQIVLCTERTQVCERIVTGTKVIPASTYTTPERVEEIVEWKCADPVSKKSILAK